MERLEQVLEDEQGILERFLRLLHREREVAGEWQAEWLLERCREKEFLLGKIREAEGNRASILARLGRNLGGSGDSPWTLARVLEMPEIPSGTRIADLRKRLCRLIAEIRKSHGENSRLMLHSLALVRDSLRTLEMLTDSCPVYGRSGRVHGQGSGGRMVSKAA